MRFIHHAEGRASRNCSCNDRGMQRACKRDRERPLRAPHVRGIR